MYDDNLRYPNDDHGDHYFRAMTSGRSPHEESSDSEPRYFDRMKDPCQLPDLPGEGSPREKWFASEDSMRASEVLIAIVQAQEAEKRKKTAKNK